MAHIMTKCGSQDNVMTYEHICDTVADMQLIEKKYKTIGSVCIVIQGESGGLEVYMMGSDKQWAPLSIVDDSTPSLSLHVCTSNEVDSETGLPDIDTPDENTFYFVASQEEDNNLYTEYIYVDNGWEKIGGTTLDLSGYAPIASPVFTGSISLGRKANTTVGEYSSAVGYDVTASYYYSHAEGYGTTASGMYGSHAEGNNTTASGYAAHAEGSGTTASNQYTHAEGGNTVASKEFAHAEGGFTTASGKYSHAEGSHTTASAYYAHAEGDTTLADGQCSHAEGQGSSYTTRIINNQTYNLGAHGNSSHAEGCYTIAQSDYSHAEGGYTSAIGRCSHTEGENTIATGEKGHAEGYYSVASGYSSHAEGLSTIANTDYAHVQGRYNVEFLTFPAWEANHEYSVGDIIKYSWSIYICTTAHQSTNSFDNSKWEYYSYSSKQAFIVGNGKNEQNRSNALTLDWSGDLHLAKDLYVNANADGTGGTKLTPLPTLPSSDGTYTLQVVISSGAPIYSWVASNS